MASARALTGSLLLGAVLSPLLALPAIAAPGDPDPSFSGNGRVTTNFGPGLDEGTDVALLTDGRIVVVGSAGGRFAVVRYEADGSLDSSFGGDGKVTTNFRKGTDRATGVAIQPNGRIVVAGINGVDEDGSFAVARYLPDGALDASFSKNGKVKTNLTPFIDGANDVAIQPDGRIVVVGFAKSIPLAHSGAFAVARYRRGGGLDRTFGNEGKVRTNFSDDFDGASGVAIQPNGRIVAAGAATGVNPSFALARYLPDGSLDPSFGDDGRVRTNFSPFGAEDRAQDLALQPDGRIVAVGFAREPDFAFALARYRKDGRLDHSFGGNGKVRTGFGPLLDLGEDVAIQPDGAIVAVGFSDRETGGASFAVARYSGGGALDGSFGQSGKVILNFTPGHDEANGVVLQPDGRIVCAGVAENIDAPWANPRFAAARLTVA